MNEQQATVHLRVPAETKARWVKAAQAEGLKLSEWIARAVEAHLSEAPAVDAHKRKREDSGCLRSRKGDHLA